MPIPLERFAVSLSCHAMAWLMLLGIGMSAGCLSRQAPHLERTHGSLI